jgi:hypothetical protein
MSIAVLSQDLITYAQTGGLHLVFFGFVRGLAKKRPRFKLIECAGYKFPEAVFLFPAE